MSCIVLDTELADKQIITKLVVFLGGKFRGYSFRLPKKYKPTKQAFWCTANLLGIMGNSGRLDYNELANILPRAVNGEFFAEVTEECKILGNLLDKMVENLENHGCPKVQDLVGEKMLIYWSHPFRDKTTLHIAERKAKLFANWMMRHLML